VKCALLITKGFKDLLYIGQQSRPRIFDLSMKRPEVLYERVVEVDERVTIWHPFLTVKSVDVSSGDKVSVVREFQKA
jgi:5-oxoprolinase (ATP-hydrolysing)